MNIPKLPFSFPDVVRYPLHAVVYLLLMYFIYKEFFTKKDECAILRVTASAQADRISKLEKDKDDLTWAIAVKSGIIDQLKSKKDSSNIRSNENIN